MILHLQRVTLETPPEGLKQVYPFNLPAIRAFQEIEFNRPVTFFVGDNGTGKSTLLEALACAVGSIVAGGEEEDSDQSMESVRELSECLRLAWSKRTHRGFFLRAEDFFGYAKRMSQLRAELEADLRRVQEEFQEESESANMLAQSPHTKELRALEERYGDGLEFHSHGERFLEFFRARFVPGGLYLLDEPESPLSPLRQLTLIAMLKEMVAEESQFIIATHSPMLLAFPEATILDFSEEGLHKVAYEDVEHVGLMRSFLNDPAQYLRYL